MVAASSPNSNALSYPPLYFLLYRNQSLLSPYCVQSNYQHRLENDGFALLNRKRPPHVGSTMFLTTAHGLRTFSLERIRNTFGLSGRPSTTHLYPNERKI